MSVRRFFSRPSGVALLSIGLSGPLPAVRNRAAGETIFLHQIVLHLIGTRV